jgi:probable HAF family extracellular repeat protein
LLLEPLENRCLLSYTLTDLGTLPGGTFSQGYGLNQGGLVAGIGDIPNPNVDRAFLYSPKLGPLDLGSLNDHASEGFALNDWAQVTGFSDVPSAFHAFLADPRHGIQDLGTLGGDFSVGYGINDQGQVTGWSDLTHGSGGFPHHAFLYFGGSMQDLGTLGGPTSEGWAINQAGQVAGLAYLSSGAYHAFLDTNGAMQDLGTLGGTNSAAYGVNNQGQVTGTAEVGSVSHAFLYSGGVLQDLGTLGGSFSTGYGINNLGQVVGSSQFGAMSSHAFLYSAGQMTDLNNLIPPGVTLSDARGINDQGLIVANGQDATTGQFHAYLLTPGTAPATGGRLRSPSVAVSGLVPLAEMVASSLARETSGLSPQRGEREETLVASDGRQCHWSSGSTQPEVRVFSARPVEEQPVEGFTDPLLV